jgi:hypothetical protein
MVNPIGKKHLARYSSAVPTVRSAVRRTSGSPKTHGSVIPDVPNAKVRVSNKLHSARQSPRRPLPLATSTRTVIIEASPSIVPADDASTTATSTAQ